MANYIDQLVPVSEAVSELKVSGDRILTVIGTEKIRGTFDEQTLGQAVNARCAPGITEAVLTPDAHVGYGAPIGCVMTSPTHIYPGPVGVDIKCSMSLIQFDLPADELADKRVRRQLIEAICARTPTGPGTGQRNVPKSRHIPLESAIRAILEGGSEQVCREFGVPFEWTERCEDSFHRGHDGTVEALANRLQTIRNEHFLQGFSVKMEQFGSYGGGNHFGECEITKVADNDRARRNAEVFGLRDGCVSFMSHCGSRGFGNLIATNQFKLLAQKFKATNTSFPGEDSHLVYARIGSHEADDYLDDMALGANFATVNHLLINSLIIEAFDEVFPGIKSNFVYLISHNIARRETLDGQSVIVHRKGATRAFPAGHEALVGTPFETTGHPILLPGNPLGGSAIMTAEPGARLSCYSINHGAGRLMGRRNAMSNLNQRQIDSEFNEADVLFNGRFYPKDEAPAAYKKFDDVLESVEQAGLASVTARLYARFVIKDGDKADD